MDLDADGLGVFVKVPSLQAEKATWIKHKAMRIDANFCISFLLLFYYS